MVVTKVYQIKHVHKLQEGMRYVEDVEKTAVINQQSEPNTIEVLHIEGYMSYITNSQKTTVKKNQVDDDFPIHLTSGHSGEQLVSCYGVVSPTTAAEEFLMTKRHAKQVIGERNNGQPDVLAHHIIQSFSPDDALTPQEVHEIGRRTVLELTGGQHEFVIATHMDKGHLHNHIIFNTTNSVTLKKFRWQKGTKRSLMKISDKHAELYGARILEPKMRNSRRDYAAYQRRHVHKYEIKERLDFLMKYATSWENFVLIAKALDLEVNTSRKETRYKLLDRDQERYTRSGTLSTKGRYDQEVLEQRLLQNQATLTIDTVKAAYQEFQREKASDFELKIALQPWQVEAETERGVYLKLDVGLSSSGTVFIPAQHLDKVEGGGYDLYVKGKDYFYFIDEKYAQTNRYMSGEVVARQLGYDNGQLLIRKNVNISRLDNLIREFEFLSKHQVTNGQQFEDLLSSFKQQVSRTESELEVLDGRLTKLNKAQSALLEIERTGQVGQVAQEILAQQDLPSNLSAADLGKLIKEVCLERDLLWQHFTKTLTEHKTYEQIKKNVTLRDVSTKKAPGMSPGT